MRYFHSVHLIESKCKGCVNCIKRCPTEAIRVRGGKAHILEERCIDCGECVRTCPNKAKEVLADPLDVIKEFRYSVAIPAPAIYGQFRAGTDPEKVLRALMTLGFDNALDVAFAADLVAVKSRELVQKTKVKPIISSACPAVVRLIQVRFPNLIEHIAPIISPMRAAARIARSEVQRTTDIPDDQVGVFFITPCPAKVSAVREPAGVNESCINGAIPISAIFPQLQHAVSHTDTTDMKPLRFGSGLGIGWGRAGGENQSIGVEKHLAVDGIHNVIDILEDVERGKLSDMNYIEAQACVGGCVGGVLAIENSFITRRRIRMIASEPERLSMNDEQRALMREGLALDYVFNFDKPIQPRPTLRLDDDMATAIHKLAALEKLVENLPGLDCGSCGAPNCRALAEDVVQGLATETDCVFKLREKVQLLAEELMMAAAQMPQSMGAAQKSDPATSDEVIVHNHEKTSP